MKKLILIISLLIGNVFMLFPQNEADKDFNTFLKQFVSSAEFQYSRVRFPLETPIILVGADGTEHEIPFTMEEWPLLGKDDLKVFKKKTPEGILFGNFSIQDKDHVEYEAGLEESELDLNVVFDLVDGKWYVTDCFNSCYATATPEDIDGIIYEVQQANRKFMEKYP